METMGEEKEPGHRTLVLSQAALAGFSSFLRGQLTWCSPGPRPLRTARRGTETATGMGIARNLRSKDSRRRARWHMSGKHRPLVASARPRCTCSCFLHAACTMRPGARIYHRLPRVTPRISLLFLCLHTHVGLWRGRRSLCQSAS